ncbi:MAG: hypothetical protein ACJA1R_002723 [Flavobacteriales bacterium]
MCDCRDFDGDRRGVGACGTAGAPVSAVDCDDLNADAYDSTRDPDHAFPELCGEFDNNCNGLSDASEQVGSSVYPEEHCTACGDVCSGVEPNATRQCQTSVDTEQPFCAVVCDDPTAFADCTAEPGCETEVTDPTRLFYRDFDGDGAGDPDDVVFACDLGEAPDGYVANSADCNDDEPTMYGAFDTTAAAAESCDGLDNDCRGGVDDNVPTVGIACSTGRFGVCAQGTFVCAGAGGLVCQQHATATAEVCDELDNDCDGSTDDPAEIAGLGAASAGSGLGICSEGAQICGGASGLSCQSRTPAASDMPDTSFTDSNCDGIDGNLSLAIFVAQFGSDSNNGSRTQPVRSLTRAAAIAAANPSGQSQILMENGVYESQATTYVNDNVTIAGGYIRSGDVWTRGSGRATLRANLPPGVRTPGFSYNPSFWPNLNIISDVNFEVSSAGTSGESAIALDCTNCTNVTMTNVTVSAGPGAIGVSGVTQTTELGGISGVAGASPTTGDGGTPLASTLDRCSGVGGTRGDYGVPGPLLWARWLGKTRVATRCERWMVGV